MIRRDLMERRLYGINVRVCVCVCPHTHMCRERAQEEGCYTHNRQVFWISKKQFQHIST